VSNRQVIALIAPSGSGKRYAASGIQLWEHHGDATPELAGRTYSCNVQCVTMRAAPAFDGSAAYLAPPLLCRFERAAIGLAQPIASTSMHAITDLVASSRCSVCIQ
jgi:hypothetical protein